MKKGINRHVIREHIIDHIKNNDLELAEAMLKTLIEEKKLNLDKDLVALFDTLDVEKNISSPTVRISREISTYGVETSIDLQQLKNIQELILKLQRETIRILGE